MHNNVQWANYIEEKPYLFCVPQTGQLGLMTGSLRNETSVPDEEEFSNPVFWRVNGLFWEVAISSLEFFIYMPDNYQVWLLIGDLST